MTSNPEPMAYVDGMLATDLVDTVDVLARPEVLDRGGWWAVAATFEGAVTAYRFARVRRAPLPPASRPWPGVVGSWRSSMDRGQYLAGVAEIQRRIAAGDVYQVNLCRVMTTDLVIPGPEAGLAAMRPAAPHDPVALARLLAAGNPSAYQGVLRTGADWIVTASPELFLARDGQQVWSSPIKGTAALGEPFADKDFPENIMITDLVRHDLGRVARTGSVTVTELLERQELPGLSHLVSTVRATLRPGVGWGELLAATLPPGSVSGAPKHTALQAIGALESYPRGPYCGAIGYIDADRAVARLAVGIRTFFTTGGGRRLHFGTGAGITHLSDPQAEWQETELKAARLVALASTGRADLSRT